MKPFLRQIAEAYFTHYANRLHDIRFVFPNRRAMTFFRYEMQRLLGEQPLPKMMAMREFAEKISGLKEGTPLFRLFTLYNCYTDINPLAEVDFDKFRFWGEMLLADFDDVDTSLADPRMLFRNVEAYKEIQSTYLTEEQQEIISRYWPNNEQEPGRAEDFWRHIKSDKEEGSQQKFMELWRVLDQLYVSYNAALAKQQKGGQGHILRRAAEVVKEKKPDNFSRCVFVGFSNMSPALLKIMKQLHAYGMADFYWDLPTKPFRRFTPQISQHIEHLAKEFPSEFTLDNGDSAAKPEIVITGVSSKAAQAAIAASQLQNWAENGVIANPENAVHTAVVLPEESLFQHVAESMPDVIGNLNITMGIALRTTPISALVSNIVAMQLRARKIKGDWVFFCEDISRVISSPLMGKLLPGACRALTEMMREKQTFMLPQRVILECTQGDGFSEQETTLFDAIFREVKDDDIESAYNYLKDILHALQELVGQNKNTIEGHFIEAYTIKLEELKEAIARHHIALKAASFLRMIERAVGAEEFRTRGEPLTGLQIMGVLETRVLDFDNVIFLSMNEGLFPNAKRHAHSFIPENLRAAYGLPSADKEQKMQSFYFFRLLSKSQNARLMYVNTTTGLGSAEMSRFLTQLLYSGSDVCSVKHTVATPPAFSSPFTPIIVEKTLDVISVLEKFKFNGSQKPSVNLSPSAINTLIDCPLRFYLHYVLGLDVDDTTEDFIDQSTYGTIVHKILELVYDSMRAKTSANPDGSFTVTKPMFNDFIYGAATALEKIVTEGFNTVCNANKKIKPDVHAELKGEQYLLAQVVKHIVQAVLKYDESLAPFDYVDSEKDLNIPLDIAPGIRVNIHCFIDRIDRIDGHLRIVDYKTGSDKTSFSDLDQLFNPAVSDRRKGILQTLLYCHLYNTEVGSNQAIQPIIYSISTVLKNPPSEIKYDKEKLMSHHSVRDFMSTLKSAVSTLFDPEEPFTQAVNPHACKYCNFRAMCSR